MEKCLVCGFVGLKEPPYDNNNYPSYEICPCCGFEYGFSDTSQGYTYKSYREEWILNGFVFFYGDLKPSNWGKEFLIEQMKNIV